MASRKLPEFLLAGYERGGTTLLSELFRANGYESGFEGGVLLGANPAAFPTLGDLWKHIPVGWGVSPQVRAEAIKGDFESFYDTLFSAAFPSHSGGFFDKTPAYMRSLGVCLRRAPFARAIVIHRDPRSVFLSQSSRIVPGVDAETAINRVFAELVDRYLSYFLGSIGHLCNPRVLFVPFEEFVSRESTWLQVIGQFSVGRPFQRIHRVRFPNASVGMKPSKVTECQKLSKALQERILRATKLASLFFADPYERIRHGGVWQERLQQAREILNRDSLPDTGMTVVGRPFEPLTYLLRYPDVARCGVNPVEHYTRHGAREGRTPA